MYLLISKCCLIYPRYLASKIPKDYLGVVSYLYTCDFFLMIRRPPRSTPLYSSAASDVYKRQDPENALIVGYQNCDSVYFEVPNGEIAGMAGVHSNGQIWMLCTPAIYDYPHTFAREAKRYVNARKEKLLWNIVDERNKVHIKLLRFLGFKFLRRFPYGPNNLSFIEFCRVQSSSS